MISNIHSISSSTSESQKSLFWFIIQKKFYLNHEWTTAFNTSSLTSNCQKLLSIVHNNTYYPIFNITLWHETTYFTLWQTLHINFPIPDTGTMFNDTIMINNKYLHVYGKMDIEISSLIIKNGCKNVRWNWNIIEGFSFTKQLSPLHITETNPYTHHILNKPCAVFCFPLRPARQ